MVEQGWIASHVVDAASIAVSRRYRPAKTDRIDGEILIRTLLAWVRGKPRVFSKVRVPTIDDEDARRIDRERQTLIEERKRHVNRIKGLHFGVGLRDYEPARRDRRACLDKLRTGEGQALPAHLRARIGRKLDRLELLLEQIKAVEAERDGMASAAGETSPLTMLRAISGMSPEIANTLVQEGLARPFDNRRPRLPPMPVLRHCRGVAARSIASKASRNLVIPGSARPWTSWHGCGFAINRTPSSPGGSRKGPAVAEAGAGRSRSSRWRRKLLVALWKYATSGVVIEGAVLSGVRSNPVNQPHPSGPD